VIDPDAYADYETWKAKKIAGQIDISISTYNSEVSALAAAWEAGARYAHKTSDDIVAIMDGNPYRKRGMMGAPPE
jgi:hypothetical protein